MINTNIQLSQSPVPVPLGAVTNGEPIEEWIKILQAADDKSAMERLRRIYRDNYPTQGELIFTAGCELECAHCIYPPDYAKYNRSLSVEKWLEISRQLIEELNIQTFVYGGRSLTKSGVKFLTALRKMAPQAHIGMIDNGLSLARFREELAEIGLDWIDISLDGLEHEHDIQRRKKGSYRQALESALWLKEHAVVPKVNILTCLTTINRNSVIPMLREVNGLGFKNFFITPVTVYDGYRPNRELVVSGSEFTDFIQELENVMPDLNDVWVELNIFAAEYMAYIGEGYRSLWDNLMPQHDCLAREESYDGSNEFIIHYYPSSLTGIKEFIINTNGNVIFPKVMAKGIMTKLDRSGTLLESRALDIVCKLPNSNQFSFYCQELEYEKIILKPLI